MAAGNFVRIISGIVAFPLAEDVDARLIWDWLGKRIVNDLSGVLGRVHAVSQCFTLNRDPVSGGNSMVNMGYSWQIAILLRRWKNLANNKPESWQQRFILDRILPAKQAGRAVIAVDSNRPAIRVDNPDHRYARGKVLVEFVF